MGTFVLFNFQAKSILEGADTNWRNIPELQKQQAEWTHPVVHCKVPIRAILTEEDWNLSSNCVSFVLVPTARHPSEVEVGLLPHLFSPGAEHMESVFVASTSDHSFGDDIAQ